MLADSSDHKFLLIQYFHTSRALMCSIPGCTLWDALISLWQLHFILSAPISNNSSFPM